MYSKEYDRKGHAFQTTLSIIDSIEEKAISRKIHWRAKYSALGALCEIGNIVVGSKSDLGPGIRRRFQGDRSLEDVVGNMVAELTENVRSEIFYKPDADGELLEVQFQQSPLDGRHPGFFNRRDNSTQLHPRDSRQTESDREENGSDEDEYKWAMARHSRIRVLYEPLVLGLIWHISHSARLHASVLSATNVSSKSTCLLGILSRSSANKRFGSMEAQ